MTVPDGPQATQLTRCHPGSLSHPVFLFLAQPHNDVQVPHSNNETKFEHRWTNNFNRIFDLFVSPPLITFKNGCVGINWAGDAVVIVVYAANPSPGASPASILFHCPLRRSRRASQPQLALIDKHVIY